MSEPTVRVETDVSVEDMNYLSAHARAKNQSVSELVAEVIRSAIRSASDNR